MNEATLPPLPVPSEPKTSALAIWSLILGICALVFLLVCLGPLFAIPAVICGHMAMSRIKRSAPALTGGGMALAGLITGYIAVALSVVMIPVMAAMMLPALAKAKDRAQQITCINQLRQIDAATRQWAQEKNRTNDVPTWDDLNPYLTHPPLICPARGIYTLGTATQPPTCSFKGHALP